MQSCTVLCKNLIGIADKFNIKLAIRSFLQNSSRRTLSTNKVPPYLTTGFIATTKIKLLQIAEPTLYILIISSSSSKTCRSTSRLIVELTLRVESKLKWNPTWVLGLTGLIEFIPWNGFLPDWLSDATDVLIET